MLGKDLLFQKFQRGYNGVFKAAKTAPFVSKQAGAPAVLSQNRSGAEILSDDLFILYGRRYKGGNTGANKKALEAIKNTYSSWIKG